MFTKTVIYITDDHLYKQTCFIPTIDIIEFDPSTENKFNKHWYTHGDDMNNIDVETLNAVGQTLMKFFIESKFLMISKYF